LDNRGKGEVEAKQGLHNADGKRSKCGAPRRKSESRKRGDYSYVKLTGGEWLISSDAVFV
jgi:hypothetical protein